MFASAYKTMMLRRFNTHVSAGEGLRMKAESLFAILIVFGSWALIIWAYVSWKRSRQRHKRQAAEQLRQTWAEALPWWDAYIEDGRQRGQATYDCRANEYAELKRRVDGSLNGTGAGWPAKLSLAASVLKTVDQIAQGSAVR